MAKTIRDLEKIRDRIDINTPGGYKRWIKADQAVQAARNEIIALNNAVRG